MENNKLININCQLTMTVKEVARLVKQLNHLTKNLETDILKMPANDEVFLLSRSSKGYSAQELCSILNISTVKEVNRLTKKLELNNEKYGAFTLNNSQEFRYNNQAIKLLTLFLKFNLVS